VCSAIQEAAAKQGIDMPNPTYTLDNRLKIDADDINGIALELREPKQGGTA
jgi:hypothetical protein